MENEIKDDEYIRTDIGKIDKVINANYYMPQYIECEKNLIFKKDIVKHSPNLKGVIQKDDFVNGDRVVAIDYTEDENGNYVDVLGIMEIDDDYAYPIELRVINIQEVVTKEMMESIIYKVKEKK